MTHEKSVKKKEAGMVAFVLTTYLRCDNFCVPADVAELVDAHDSGSCGLTPVGVRVSLSAPINESREALFCFQPSSRFTLPSHRKSPVFGGFFRRSTGERSILNKFSSGFNILLTLA